MNNIIGETDWEPAYQHICHVLYSITSDISQPRNKMKQMVLNEFFRYYIQCPARYVTISYYDMLDRRALGSPPILGIMYIKHTEFILDAPFGPPQSCLRSSYMYASVNEARFTVKQWCRTYSQLFLFHYAADIIIVEIFPCAIRPWLFYVPFITLLEGKDSLSWCLMYIFLSLM